MKISVVVTALNHENTVIESIESILSQTRLPDEIGLALGPSRDKTDGMTEFYEDEFDFVHRDRRPDVANCGLMHLRLGSLSSVTGEYVLFLRGDSYLRPRVLERIDQTGGKTELLLSPAEFIGGVSGHERLPPPVQWAPQALLEAGATPSGTVAWPRKVLEEKFADLQGLKLGPFSTLGWLLQFFQDGIQARALEETFVEIWDDRDGPTCWTGSVFKTLSNLVTMLERRNYEQELVNRIRSTIDSLPAEFRPSSDNSFEDSRDTEAEPLEWIISRMPLVE